MATYEDWSTVHLLNEMRRRGYHVRHESEVVHNLSWHHLDPAPDGFEEQAVLKIREQLTARHLRFETRDLPDGKKVRSGFLKIV